MRPSEVLARAGRYLDRHGVDSPRVTAEVLLGAILGVERAALYTRDEGLSTPEARAFGRALCQRCSGVPLQHLTGIAGFRRLTLVVKPGVFVPRPETEVLVDAALAAINGLDGSVVVDVGTGTGAIALAIKDERPVARVLATDASEDAVALARENAERLGIDIEVLRGDLLEPLPDDLRGQVNLIVSNPPYLERAAAADLPPEVRADPDEALFGGTAVHRRLAREAPRWLARGGWLAMEIGDEQADAVGGFFGERFGEVRALRDHARRDRVVVGRFTG